MDFLIIIIQRPPDLCVSENKQFLEAVADFLAVNKLSVVIGEFSLSYFKNGGALRAGALLEGIS